MKRFLFKLGHNFALYKCLGRYCQDDTAETHLLSIWDFATWNIFVWSLNHRLKLFQVCGLFSNGKNHVISYRQKLHFKVSFLFLFFFFVQWNKCYSMTEILRCSVCVFFVQSNERVIWWQKYSDVQWVYFLYSQMKVLFYERNAQRFSGCLGGVILKALESRILEGELEIQCLYYVHIRTNMKDMKPLSS